MGEAINSLTGKRVLLVGCGYVGQALAQRLRNLGTEVTAWVRTEKSAAELAAQGLLTHAGNVSDAADWQRLSGSFDAAIHGPSSGRRGVEAYREVYVEGMRQVVRHCPQARLVFISSTSVYGQTDGEWVDETSLTKPPTDTGKQLLEAEALCRDARGTAVRVAGIYGPGRGVLMKRLLAGDAVIEGDGTRWINQAHRDDIAAGLVHLLGADAMPDILNICDNEPTTYNTFYHWACDSTGRPFPPYGPPNPLRKRGLTNKRVSNGRLRALGWEPLYPSFREGYEQQR